MHLSHDQVREDPGDDSVVLRAYLRWVDSTKEVLEARLEASPCGHVQRTTDGSWELVFSIRRGQNKRQRHFVLVDPDAVRADRWPMKKLARGVWDFPKSICIDDQFHGFVTLVGVPDRAPWEIKVDLSP